MSFELFTEYGAASREEATIRARGSIFLSDAIIKRVEHGDPEGAKLYYDGRNGRLGIELLQRFNRKDKGQRKVTKEKSGISVNAAPLLRYFGFELGKKQTATVSFEEQMIIIDLSKVPQKLTNSGEGGGM